jgi:hypothetical protein
MSGRYSAAPVLALNGDFHQEKQLCDLGSIWPSEDLDECLVFII